MRKLFDRYTLAGAALGFFVWLAAVPSSTIASIIQAVIPQVVPVANKVGNSSKFQLGSSSNAFIAGECLEYDSNGNSQPSGSACVGGGTVIGTVSAIFTSTSSATDSSTGATSIVGTGSGAQSLPANFFVVGSSLLIEASGVYSSTITPGTLTINLKFGSTTIATTGAVTPLVSITNGAWRLRALVTCRTTGGTGTVIVNTIFELAPSSLSVLTGADASMVNTSAVTIDTTAIQLVDLTANFSSSGQSITGTNFAFAPFGSGYATIQNGGSGIAQEPILNFLANNITCVDSSGSTRSDCKVVGVNSTSVPTNAAADQVLQTTGAATGAWKSVPDCDDTAGQHLNYDTGTHAWSCGTSSGSTSGFTLVEQHTASTSATLDFTTCISSTYDDYVIDLVNFLPATSAVNLLMRVSTDGGATYDSGTNYNSNALQFLSGGTGTSGGGSGQTSFAVAAGISVASGQPGVSGRLNFFNPGSSTQRKNLTGQVSFSDVNGDPRLLGNAVAFQYQSNTAVNAFRFLMSSGNIASGTIRCYGLSK